MCSEPARGSGLRTTRLPLILLSGSFESGHPNPRRASGGGLVLLTRSCPVDGRSAPFLGQNEGSWELASWPPGVHPQVPPGGGGETTRAHTAPC